MDRDFHRWMAEATRLTRAGDLAAATELIQQALHGRAHAGAQAAAAADAEVIDVECHEVLHPEGHLQRIVPLDARTMDPIEDDVPTPQVVHGRSGTGRAARDFRLFVPPQAALGEPLPMIVMLHGCTQDPEDFAAGTAMNDLACRHGFYVLYPAQAKHANPKACWNWFKAHHQQRGRGEVSTLAAMIRQTQAAHGIDPSRVYAAGLSAGGAMAVALARAYPDLVAAIGVHSGLSADVAHDLPSALAAMHGRAARAPQPLSTPTIVFHGDADHTVHPHNAEALFEAVMAGHGPVRSERLGGRGKRRVTRHRRESAGGRIVAEHWVLHGAGHTWSGGDPSGSHTDADGPDASQEMVRFFAAHRLCLDSR